MDLYLESTKETEINFKDINDAEIAIKQEYTDFHIEIEIENMEIKYEEPNITNHNEYNGMVTKNTYIRDFCEKTFSKSSFLKQQSVINKSPPIKEKCIENLPGINTNLNNFNLKVEELNQISNENIYKVLYNPQEYNITEKNIKGNDNTDVTFKKKMHDKQNYTCKACGKNFSRSVNLKKHYLVHSDDKNSQCDTQKNKPNPSKNCGKQITKSLHLKKLKLINSGKVQYKCNICKKSFAKNAGLKQHSLIHTGIKNYKCDICDKCFTQSSGLKQHYLIHTGEKNYKCDICNKLFTQPSHLQQHHLTHTGEKNYKCDICEKYFTQLSHLQQHYLIHTGKKNYKCDICEKSFTQLSHLQQHYLIHTGEKNYKCDNCKQSFTQLSHLNKHCLFHSGKNLFK